MKALIIEDEILSLNSLRRLLERNFPDIEVSGTARSVDEAVSYLQKNTPDIIFMDVQLLDGTCFDIFIQVDIKSPVVMTTAFDEYVLKAFEAGSVDYLLKPIEIGDLRRSVARCMGRFHQDDARRVLSSALQVSDAHEGKVYKGRLLVRIGETIYPIKTEDIAIIYSEQKSTYLLTFSSQKYFIAPTLEEVMAELDPKKFFRVSRSCVVARDAIDGVESLRGGRYLLKTHPQVPFPVEVSRARSDDFYIWKKWS